MFVGLLEGLGGRGLTGEASGVDVSGFVEAGGNPRSSDADNRPDDLGPAIARLDNDPVPAERRVAATGGAPPGSVPGETADD